MTKTSPMGIIGLMTAEGSVEIHFGREHRDPKKPLDMRDRFFRLPSNTPTLELADARQEISALPPVRSVQILPSEDHVDVMVSMGYGNCWVEGGKPDNTTRILGALGAAAGQSYDPSKVLH